MYTIEFNQDAIADLKWFQKSEQNRMLDGIEANLQFESTVETRNRGQLRPNRTAEWKLRIVKLRVYYDLDETEQLVSVVAIGLKIGNAVYFRGTERDL